MFPMARRLMTAALLLVSLGALSWMFAVASASAGGVPVNPWRALCACLGLPGALALAALAIDQLSWRRARGCLRRFAERCGPGAQLALAVLGQEKGNLWYEASGLRIGVRLCSAHPGHLGVDMAEAPRALRTALGLRWGRSVRGPLTEVVLLPGAPLLRPFGLRIRPRWFGRAIRSARQLKRHSAFLVDDAALARAMQSETCVAALLALCGFHLLRIDVRAGGFSVRCGAVLDSAQALEALIANARIALEAYAAVCGVTLDDAPAEAARSDLARPALASSLAQDSGEAAPAGAPSPVARAEMDSARRWAPPGYFDDAGEVARAKDGAGDPDGAAP